jgi:predicted O-methyltransferase YrrM
LYNRFKLFLYEIKHPDYPWLTPLAIEILSNWLRKTDSGLEYGCGRSTLWFARRVAQLTSVEHNHLWYKVTKKKLAEYNINNVNLTFCRLIQNSRSDKLDYIRIADSFPDGSLDFVLVDGMFRDDCALAVLRKIRAGGLLIIDNVNWYIPSTSSSPNSRTARDGPASQKWELLSELLKEWRYMWTSNNVTDTAIFIKPC